MTSIQQLTPRQQLQAGRRTRRLVQLVVGLWLYGTSMAMMLHASLGLDPWDVFHAGVQGHVGWSFGTVVVAASVVVLALWVPLRQWPGLGTVANAVLVGVSTDVMLHVVPAPDALAVRAPLLLAGIVLNGLASALYIGAQFGPGPRDGLMTGLAHRTGGSLRLIRTGLEVLVLAVGWGLGGQAGAGTVLYALGIGPLVQFFLPHVVVRVDAPDARVTDVTCGPGGDVSEQPAVNAEPR